MKHFGAVLKKHIETNGLKKGEVAQGAGITYSNFGANEALYKALLDEKERYIKSLEAQIAELKGTKTEQ